MLEVTQNFEQIAARFSPIVLISPGLAAVLLGLFVWLGGLGFRRVLAAVVGAVSGGICVSFIAGRNIILAVVSTALATVIAIIFEKIFITILAATLAAVLGFAVLARPYIEEPATAIPINQDEISNRAETLGGRQTVEIIKAYIADFSTKINQACSQMPAYSWAIIVASAVIFIVGGFFLWRLTSALCCAALGTLLVFAGMILLLLYKGAAPISGIYNRTSFYAAVFIAMTAFGTTMQLSLIQRREKLITKKETNKDNKATDKPKLDWRNI